MSTLTTENITSLTVINDSFQNGMTVTGGVVTPTILSSTPQHDYNPTNLANCSILRLSASIPVTITGLAGGVDGRRLTLVNTATIPITITSDDVLSTAGNRFALGGINARLVAGAVLGIVYDGNISSWRVNSATAGAATPGGLVQSVWSEVSIDTDTSLTTWPIANTTIRITTVLPSATIPVVSTAGFLASGQIRVLNTAGNYQTLTYTSITGGANPTFNGVTGGTGTLPIIAGLATSVWQRPRETTIAAGSNGQVLPQTTINVASTTGFPASGQILVSTTAGQQRVPYTGVTATTFTGCTGGTGTMNTGNEVRDITANAQDLIRLELTSQGGALIIISAASVQVTNNQTVFFQILVDNLIIRGGAASGNGGAPGGSTVIGLKLTDIPAGDHVAVLRWRISGGSAQLYPVRLNQITNANMLIQEVSS
jgi:hypothetical protein